MSDEEKKQAYGKYKQAKEKWQNMSDDEQQDIKDKLSSVKKKWASINRYLKK